MQRSTQVVNKILSIFRRQGQRDYIGEQVTQLSHALQCAKIAKSIPETNLKECNTHEFVTAALCHDIGHLLVYEPYKIFDKPLEKLVYIDQSDGPKVDVNLGVKYHEHVGSAFMKKLGFSNYVCTLIENHVDAKRYLITTNPSYIRNISSASLETLRLQGGIMTKSEVEEFRKAEFFNDVLLLRYIDDLSKNVNTRPSVIDKEFIPDLYGSLAIETKSLIK